LAINANRRIPVSHESPQGFWTRVPCDGKKTGSPLDQWDMVRMKWDCRICTGLPPSSRLCPIAANIQVQYRVSGVHPTGLTIARGVSRCPQLHILCVYELSVDVNRYSMISTMGSPLYVCRGFSVGVPWLGKTTVYLSNFTETGSLRFFLKRKFPFSLKISYQRFNLKGRPVNCYHCRTL
jgi:hypothetical protein